MVSESLPKRRGVQLTVKSSTKALGASTSVVSGGQRAFGSRMSDQLALFRAAAVDSAPLPALTREDIEVGLGIVEAETWPSRYKIHKYWGRKPANVVSKYIEFFSRPGEQVFDPFAGSGVTVVEGARLGRRTVGFDLNPFAARLSNAMLSPPDPDALAAAAESVLAQVIKARAILYECECDACGGRATLRSVGYAKDEPIEVRYWCDVCRKNGKRKPTTHDIRRIRRKPRVAASTPDDDILMGWEMRKLARRGVRRWRELFTPRNFATAGTIREAILRVEDERSREWLLLSLTASLAQFTKMIADFAGDAGGPSWKINCYWLPDRWQELNPIWYFENRIAKSLDSARDLVAQGAPFMRGLAQVADSREIPLPSDSVDYVFTDPPYGGEGIQYGELSLLWCLWLGERQALDREVAYNPYRKLDANHYAQGLRRVFAECHRVLKPGRWMTVTFANKDPVVWDVLMQACRDAGFTLVTAAPMKRSAPSLTETTMHSAPKADLVLNFQKTLNAIRAADGSTANYDMASAIERIVRKMIHDGIPITEHTVFDRVTVDWFSWFYANGTRPEAVRPTLDKVEAELLACGPSIISSFHRRTRSA